MLRQADWWDKALEENIVIISEKMIIYKRELSVEELKTKTGIALSNIKYDLDIYPYDYTKKDDDAFFKIISLINELY